MLAYCLENIGTVLGGSLCVICGDTQYDSITQYDIPYQMPDKTSKDRQETVKFERCSSSVPFFSELCILIIFKNSSGTEMSVSMRQEK